MDNRTFGLQALKYWYQASNHDDFGFVTWGMVVDHYDKAQATFINDLGATVRKLEQSRYKKAMESLGKAHPTAFPHSSMFYDSLSKEFGSVTVSDVKDAVVDAAKQVGEVGFSLGKNYVLILALFAGAALFLNLGGARALKGFR